MLCIQDESVYLRDPIDYLIRRLGSDFHFVRVILFSPNPLGRRRQLLSAAYRVFRIFGFMYFWAYLIRYLILVVKSQTLGETLGRHGLQTMRLRGSINSEYNINLLRSLEADLLISITANEIFSVNVLNCFKFGALNLHSSLLPSYRGLMPAFWTLSRGEKIGGVTVFQVNEGIDTGNILVQKPISLVPPLTLEQLIRHTKYLGMEALIEAIGLIIDDRPLPHISVDESYFKSPSRADVLDFYRRGGRFF